MPRIRIIDKMFDQCKAAVKEKVSQYDFLKETSNFKQGDVVRCVERDFKEYSYCKVICLLKRHNYPPLILAYVPNLHDRNVIVWGEKVLALQESCFEKI